MNLSNDMIITSTRAIAKSYAKINLTLDVLGKFPNGYHEIKTIMQSINLFDLIIIDKQAEGIDLSSNLKFLPNGNKNIAYQAAELFFSETKICGGAKILIHKNIPVAAGLAGGSGNAAAVLAALNLLYDAHLSDAELERIALKLGADVPYCLYGGTLLAEGIGEKLSPLPPLPILPVVLVKPPVNISTAMIYKKIDSTPELKHPNTNLVIRALDSGDIAVCAANMSNVMEGVTLRECSQIADIKKCMLDMGALGSIMSGSGPSVFGIFPNNAVAKSACDKFSECYEDVFLTHTIP